MEIGGLQEFTLIDYPDTLACTGFTLGCNFRCPYCYSKELVLPQEIKNHPRLPEERFFRFLRERTGLLEGVCICGGEPTIHKDLPEFIGKIKDLEYKVKLDTNGSHPQMLKKLIKERLLDYVAIDVKSPKEKYEFFSGAQLVDKVEESINILKENKVDYEFRTTVAPGLKGEDILKMAEWVAPAKNYFLQEFEGKKEVLDPKVLGLPLLGRGEIEKIVEELKGRFARCEVR